MWNELRDLLKDANESVAIGLACEVQGEGTTRLLVRDVVTIPDDAYDLRTTHRVSVNGSFVARVVERARRDSSTVVFIHTHPFDDDPHFSSVDDEGEDALRSFLRHRIPGRSHAALVVGRNSASARWIGRREEVDVEIAGSMQRHWPAPSRRPEDGAVDELRYNRQIVALGNDAQRRLGNLNVAIVGVGGTGSAVLQQVAHLGVRSFVLVDPDVVEPSNLNRLIGSEPSDAEANTTKVDVATRLVKRIQPSAAISAHRADVTYQRIARKLLDCDAVFGCTDSHGSRYVLNQLAYQYMVPVFDMGVALVAGGGKLTHVIGRAQHLGPGAPCLTCHRTLDSEQVRRDLLSAFERQRDPYVIGASEQQPAVVSFNSTVASLAVTMFLSSFAGAPATARHQLYDGVRGMVRPVMNTPVENCVTCSPVGAFGRGDDWPMPGRAT